MGYPSEWEDLLLPYADNNTDETPVICGMAPTLYVNVPPSTIRAVIAKHGGMTVDSGRLPRMVEVNEWEEAAPVPSDLNMTDDTECVGPEGADPVMTTSVVQLGTSSLPSPPPTPPVRSALTPPARLREITTSTTIANTHDEDEGDKE